MKVKLNKPISVIDDKMYVTDIGDSIDENNLPIPVANWKTKDIVIGDNLCKIEPLSNDWWTHAWNGVPFIGKSIFKSNLDNLESGEQMFQNEVLYEDASGSEYLPRLDFISDLPNLKNGTSMFEHRILDKFVKNESGEHVNLSNLEIGNYMFYNSGINTDEIYSIDMPKLRSGVNMFNSWNPYYSGNRIYTGNLESLEDGSGMFGDEYDGSSCDEFYSDLPSLKYGTWMNLCKYKFRGSLPALVTGDRMFSPWYGAHLDALSIFNIVNTLPDRTGLENGISVKDGYYSGSAGVIDIGLGCDDNDEDRQLYAQEGGFTSFQEILDRFSAKNWEANLTCNRRPTQTYSLRRTINEIASQLWVKLEEVVIQSDKKKKQPHAYTSQDGNKFYNLKYHHFTTGNNEGYTQFNSLEEAEQYFNIKPIERN